VGFTGHDLFAREMREKGEIDDFKGLPHGLIRTAQINMPVIPFERGGEGTIFRSFRVFRGQTLIY